MRQRRLKRLEEKLREYENRVIIDRQLLKGHWQEMFSETQPLFLELGSGKAQFIIQMAKAYPERNFIAIEGNSNVVLRALQKAEKSFNNLGLKNPGLRENWEEREKFTPEKICEKGEDGNENSKNGKNGENGKSNKNSEDSEDSKNDQNDENDKNRENGKNYEDLDKLDTIWLVAPNLIFVNMYMRGVGDCFSKDELSGMYLNFSDPWPKARHRERRLTHRGFLKGYRKALKAGSTLEFKTDDENLFRFSLAEMRSLGLEELEYSENLHDTELASANFMTEYEKRFSLRGRQIYYIKVRYNE